MSLHDQVDRVIEQSGVIAHHQKEKGERGEARVENLEELVSAARGFDTEETGDMSPLAAFLSHAVLESGEGQADQWEDSVQMMTLHSAKGLEFPLVFLCGLEEGLFPHQRSATDPSRLEEERRLCYVGLTRAMQKLYLSYAEQRRLHGVDSYGSPSRFIRELPAETLEEVRPRIQVSRPVFVPRKPMMEEEPAAGRPARAARSPRQVRRRHRPGTGRPGEPCPRPRELRAAGSQVADAGLRQSGNALKAWPDPRCRVELESVQRRVPAIQDLAGTMPLQQRRSSWSDSMPTLNSTRHGRLALTGKQAPQVKIIILGAGQVGKTAAHHLAREEANEVTVVDQNDELLRDLQDRLDIRTVVGNGAYPGTLSAAGAQDADVIIALTNSDEVNMVACQVVWKLFNKDATRIARIRSGDYIQHSGLFTDEDRAFAVDVTHQSGTAGDRACGAADPLSRCAAGPRLRRWQGPAGRCAGAEGRLAGRTEAVRRCANTFPGPMRVSPPSIAVARASSRKARPSSSMATKCSSWPRARISGSS